MLPYLPPMVGDGTDAGVKNGPALASHGAEAVGEAIAEKIAALPDHLRKSLTWAQGAKLARHAQLRIETGLAICCCDPRSPWQRGSNEVVRVCVRGYAAYPLSLRHIELHGVPETITSDKSGADKAAIEGLRADSGADIGLRESRYFDNVDEQDHRAIKTIVRPLIRHIARSMWFRLEPRCRSRQRMRKMPPWRRGGRGDLVLDGRQLHLARSRTFPQRKRRFMRRYARGAVREASEGAPVLRINEP